MSEGSLEIAIVGAGPRGLSVLERICANERAHGRHDRVIVHLVDPYRPGAGRVWRTSQSRLLLMNTVASQVTVFTDDTVDMAGPVEPGPNLYEWARTVVLPAGPDVFGEATYTEATALHPDGYPTRAFYGCYLVDAYRHIRERAPAHCRIVEHATRAVALRDRAAGSGVRQALSLADGTLLPGLDAVVLALGHLPELPSARESDWSRAATRRGLTYVRPANPADLDLSCIEPGQTVLVRGLGLNFFDQMALLTRGRGGTFVRRSGRLVYVASGREPRIHAGSRRGIPYHARGENEKGVHGRHQPRLLTPRTIETLRRRGQNGERVHFATDLWPLIAKEVESVYYETVLRSRHEIRAADFGGEYLAADTPGQREAVLRAHNITEDERWDWDRLQRPTGGRLFADRADFHRWLLDYLAEDVREARNGNVSGPLKAALDVLRDLRNEIRLAVDHGGLEGNSYRDDLKGWYTPLNAFLSIGPPASRIEELSALIEAGVVQLLGPETEFVLEQEGDHGAFVAASPQVIADPVRASVLIEARLPEPDVRQTADALLRYLLVTGQAAPYRLDGSCGSVFESGGLAVTPRPYHTVDVHGRAHPRRFAYGVPTESVHWVTAAGIRPGVNSVILGDSDAIARAVLHLPPSAPAPAPDHLEMTT
ncbi:FAD-binding protein [Streptomyces sp. A0958]|uniref:FAD/NAD(P)-binding protein n=1 Tax=Streptomyces sp. A0958 TaxID=2563101 RepID=UPI00109E489F|nr:FAD/NAD(P)-binding domain-containing protein [Streptomyces sp. A0958]THA70114.1 FAD-binding protein [Streptomyces sp. A0958]